MVNFNGKYKWVKNEDFDEYLEKMGEDWNNFQANKLIWPKRFALDCVIDAFCD